MDTTDTGDTAESAQEELPEIISASELAGETGGFSCSATPAHPSLLFGLLVGSLLIIAKRYR